MITNTKRRNTERRDTLLSSRRTFYDDFAEELDIFTDEVKHPEWVYRFREDILSKLSPTVRRVARMLHGRVNFKIKYPVEMNGKYKFADIYIPHTNTVIVCLSSHNEFGNICCKTPEKTNHFSERFNVVEVFEYTTSEDIDNKLNLF